MVSWKSLAFTASIAGIFALILKIVIENRMEYLIDDIAEAIYEASPLQALPKSLLNDYKNYLVFGFYFTLLMAAGIDAHN